MQSVLRTIYPALHGLRRNDRDGAAIPVSPPRRHGGLGGRCCYREGGRRLARALKQGDRTDRARPLGRWMAREAADLVRSDVRPCIFVVPVPVLVLVPLHRGRLWQRRYNQSALLAARIAWELRLDHCPDALW